MQLTLRQARRLEISIQEQQALLQQNLNSRAVAVSIYEKFDETIDAIQARVTTTLETIKKLSTIRYSIRRSIATVKETSGLNDLMSEEASLNELVKALQSATGPEFTENEQHVARARHEAAVVAGAKQDDYGRVTDTVSIHNTLLKGTLDVLKNQIKDAKRRLLVIVDESTALNTNRKIEVADTDIAYLETVNVVV